MGLPPPSILQARTVGTRLPMHRLLTVADCRDAAAHASLTHCAPIASTLHITHCLVSSRCSGRRYSQLGALASSSLASALASIRCQPLSTPPLSTPPPARLHTLSLSLPTTTRSSARFFYFLPSCPHASIVACSSACTWWTMSHYLQ